MNTLVVLVKEKYFCVAGWIVSLCVNFCACSYKLQSNCYVFLHVLYIAMEHFVGLYVFVTYLEETDFLFDRQTVSYELDFHGSFYAGIVSFVCSMIAALVVYMDDSIWKANKESAIMDDFSVSGFMSPEEFVLYDQRDAGWNMMDDNQYDDVEDGYHMHQNGIGRFVPFIVLVLYLV